MVWLLSLLIIWAGLLFFLIWPVHWIWSECSQDGPYDARFYDQRSFWRLYAWAFAAVALFSVTWNFNR